MGKVEFMRILRSGIVGVNFYTEADVIKAFEIECEGGKIGVDGILTFVDTIERERSTVVYDLGRF
jgi:hypothetical protein